MFCTHCGREIEQGSQFCDYCGRPQGATGAYAPPNAAYGNGAYPQTGGQQAGGMRTGAIVAFTIAAIAVIGAIIAVAVVLSSPASEEGDQAQSTQETSSTASREAGGASNASVANTSTHAVVSLKDAKVGDLVTYGSYEQDSDKDKEDIEWMVLDERDGHMLLLSLKALDCMPINSFISTNYDITWEKSEIREWLNDSFLEAFSESERNGIDVTRVEQANSSDGKTEDLLFLLSASEFGAYVSGDLAKAQATAYAQSRGAKVYDDLGTANWWLRDYNPEHSTTTDDNNFLNVFYDGTVNSLGYIATEDHLAVRPAMWVSRNGKGTRVDDSTAGSAGDGKDSSSSSSSSRGSSGKGGGTKDGSGEKGSRAKDGTIALTVEAADGQTLTGTVRTDDAGFVIADSSTREYSVSELKALNLSDAELCIAWNEPFARQGYHFKNPGLRKYFQACDWYVDTGNSSYLTGVAAVNNDRLRQIAEEKASSKRWENLATS